jgi:hypothetical protein
MMKLNPPVITAKYGARQSWKSEIRVPKPEVNPKPEPEIRTGARCGTFSPSAGLVALSVAVFLWAIPGTVAGDADAGPGAAEAVSKPGSRESLIFRNGDLLYGSLDSIDPESGIRWRHPDADGPIQFLPDDISEIHFPPRQRTAAVTPSTCRLQLSNNDELEGNVTVFDQDKAVLQTWYAGDITVPRKLIQSLVPVPAEGAVVYQGPTGFEGWTIGKVVSALGDAGQWKYKNGAFYATNAASIARKLDLPDVAIIEFDLAWKGLFQLAVALYTDYLQPINLANKDTEPEFGGFYSLQLNSFSANLLPVKKNDPLRYLGQISVPAFNQKNAAHIEIRASKAKRTITLLVDGQVLKQWIETEEFAGQGTGLRFVHQGQGKVKLSNLRISAWDGQMKEKPAVSPDAKLDLVRLRNGDKAAGQVESIQNGRIAVSSGGTKLIIPLSRVKQVEFAGQKVERPGDDVGNIRAIFNRGGAVTFRLEKWEAGKALGTSPNFGKLAFDATAFSRVELRGKLKAPDGSATHEK